jgi:hypothetical protein
MNFWVAFLLLVHGGKEVDAFWSFVALMSTHKTTPVMDGLRGLFKSHFSVLHLYYYQFERIFKDELPDLF